MEMLLNGERVHVEDALADEPLLSTLRDACLQNGPRLGCGAGHCGACMVHVDGVALRSCQLPTRAAEGRRIGTLDELARADGTLHPVQAAWQALRVPQCGYCQNGQLMTVAALFDAGTLGDAAATRAALDQVLCRCGTQQRIAQAIAALAHGTGTGAQS